MTVRERTATEPEPTTWSPFDLPPLRTFDLEVNGWRGAATFSGWTAGERIAFEDMTATRLMSKNDEGERVARVGRMHALHITSTIRSWEGFPAELDRRPTEEERARAAEEGRVLGDIIREPANLRRLEHVMALPEELYAQLLECAEEVQLLPGMTRKSSDSEPGGAGASQAGVPAGDGEAEVDPSPTPQTPPGEKAAAPAKTRSRSSSARAS